MLSSGGQPPHELDPQRSVGVSFWLRGDDVFCLRDVPVVQPRDYVEEFAPLAADTGQGKLCSAWTNYTAGHSAQNGGSRTATLNIIAGGGLPSGSRRPLSELADGVATWRLAVASGPVGVSVAVFRAVRAGPC